MIEKSEDPLLADIFVPECGMVSDKVVHQLFALGVIDHSDINAAGFDYRLQALKVVVFSPTMTLGMP